AGDELVLVADAHDDQRLHDAVLAHAARELLDRRFVERAAWLIGIGLDLIDRNLCQPGGVSGRRRLRFLRDQRAKTAAQDLLLIHPMTRSARRMNSLARLTYASLPRERMSYRIIGFPNDGASP